MLNSSLLCIFISFKKVEVLLILLYYKNKDVWVFFFKLLDKLYFDNTRKINKKKKIVLRVTRTLYSALA